MWDIFQTSISSRAAADGVVGNVPPLGQSRHRDRTALAAYQSRDRFCDLVIPISSVGLAWRDKRQAGKSAEKRDLATRSF